MTGRPDILFLLRAQCREVADGRGIRRELGRERVVVHSAGSAPGEHLNPAVVNAMKEKGIDISHEAPRKLTSEMGLDADVIITMGCGDACPVYPESAIWTGTCPIRPARE